MPIGNTAPADSLLGGITRDLWDQMAGRHFYSTSTWLNLCAADPGALATAAVSYGTGGVMTAVPVSELTALPSSFYRWSDLLAALGLPHSPPRGLLVGPGQGYQTHLLRSPGVDPAGTADGLVEEIRRLHRDGGRLDERGCVAMYLTTADAGAAYAAGVDALPVLLEADAWMEMPPGGWDAWLGSLPSKRRGNVRREVRRFADAGYEIRHLPLADCYEGLAALAVSTQLKYGHSGAPEDYAAALRRQVDGMGQAARVAVCSRDDDKGPVGFCVYYIWDDTIFLRWAGFDYSRMTDAAEYFNLVYYSQLRLAEELGLRWIHAGIKAPEAKALRGARLRPLWLVDLAENSVLARCPTDIRRHNARFYENLMSDPRAAAGLAEEDGWRAFG